MAFPSSASGRSVLPWPHTLIYEALIDYNNWSQWFPALKASRLLMKEESLAVVELVFDIPGEETLMMECIHTANKTVLGRVIEGRTPVAEIQWSVEPADAGASGVALSVSRKMARYLTQPVYWPILNPAACLGGLRSWMEGANPGPAATASGENLFELWETNDGLVCWIRGRKYKLIPAEEKRT
jgi:hypothetical protein